VSRKKSVAVLTGVLLVAISLLWCASAAAGESPQSPQKRTVALQKKATHTAKQVTKLQRRAERHKRSGLYRNRVLRTHRKVVALNRRAVQVNRAVLKSGATTGVLRGVIKLNAKVSRLDAKAVRLVSHVRVPHKRSAFRTVVGLRKTIDGYTQQLLKLRKPKPKPTDTPTPTPTETPTPTPTPTTPVVMVSPTGSNDRTSIQAAVDSLAANGGGIVKLAPGTFSLSGGDGVNPDCGANINVKSGVHIQGSGVGVTVVQPQSTALHPFAASQQTTIGISDMTISGAGASAYQDGCKFYCCDNVTVHNVEARNLYIGLALYGCQDSSISDCVAHDCSMGIAPSESRLGYQPTRNVRVEGCETWACSTGFKVAGYGPDDGGEVVSRVSDVTFVDCSARNGTAGYLVRYAQRITMIRATGAVNSWTNIWLAGVIDSAFSSCSTPVLSTDAYDVTHYGPCDRVVVN